MEVELKVATLRAAVLVAGMHVKILESGPDLELHLLPSGMLRLVRNAVTYYVAAAYVESCEAAEDESEAPVSESSSPPPAQEPPENRPMFERRSRDPVDKVKAIDPEIEALINGPQPKARKKK